MGLTLAQALRLSTSHCVAFVGAGGKTTAMFQLARELPPPVIITSTTHLGAWQIPLADQHVIASSLNDISHIKFEGVMLITGPVGADDRTESIDQELLKGLHTKATESGLPLLIEADGARQRSLKAPKDHEPPIPKFVNDVVVIAGLSAIGKPLSEEVVYFSDSFSKLSGIQINETITPGAVVGVLCHQQGGLKNITSGIRRTVILNQSDTPELQGIAGSMVRPLLDYFDSVVITSLKEKSIFAVNEPVAGIILAGGGSTRFGQPKQLLDWRGHPFIRAVTQKTIDAGLSQVIVVTGANASQVEAAIMDLPVRFIRNDAWLSGQASSIHVGIKAITSEAAKQTGSVIFLLVDQPQIETSVLRALIEYHAAVLQPIIAPLVMMEQRGNPVLFDRVTYPDLIELKGDVGGREIFSKHHVEYMPWHDDRLLLDVDKPEDYQRLIEDDTL